MNSHRKGTLLRAAGFGLLAIAVAAAGGCAKPKAVVNGKVRLANGQPVTAGTVSFWSSDNRVGSSALGSDGSYSVPDAPVGDVKITVSTPPPRMVMGDKGGMPKAPGDLGGGMPADKVPEGMSGVVMKPQNVVPVPEQYWDVATTTLTWTVASSKAPQEHDIVLAP